MRCRLSSPPLLLLFAPPTKNESPTPISRGCAFARSHPRPRPPVAPTRVLGVRIQRSPNPPESPARRRIASRDRGPHSIPRDGGGELRVRRGDDQGGERAQPREGEGGEAGQAVRDTDGPVPGSGGHPDAMRRGPIIGKEGSLAGKSPPSLESRSFLMGWPNHDQEVF